MSPRDPGPLALFLVGGLLLAGCPGSAGHGNGANGEGDPAGDRPPLAPEPEGAARDPQARDIPLEVLLRPVRPAGGGTLVAPPTEDIATIQEIVRRLVEATGPARSASLDSEALSARASGAGFELFRDRLGPGGAAWVLRELPAVERGGGVYVLRPGGEPILVDVRAATGPAGEAILAAGRVAFGEANAYALLLDAGPRLYEATRRPTPEEPARTFYDAVHRPIVAGLSDAAYVQLRPVPADEAARLAVRAIVSKGDAAPVEDRALERLRDRLRDRLGEAAVAIAGRDVDAATGARDPRGRYVNAYSDDRFYRIALTAEAAEELTGSPEGREALGEALRALVE